MDVRTDIFLPSNIIRSTFGSRPKYLTLVSFRYHFKYTHHNPDFTFHLESVAQCVTFPADTFQCLHYINIIHILLQANNVQEKLSDTAYF